MKRFLFLFAFVGLIYDWGIAQPGHFFLSHYKPGNDNISYLSFDIHQDNNGILYFANRSGVLQFDGRTWTQIPVNGAVYTLTSAPTGEIYAAGSAGFGRIGYNENNQLSYTSLSDSIKEVKNIFASCTRGQKIYFVNEQHVFQIDLDSMESSVLVSATKGYGGFNGLYAIGKQLYVSTNLEGLKMIAGDKKTSDMFDSLRLVFSEPSPDGKSYFLATEENSFLLLKEGLPPSEFKPKDIQYLSTSVIVNCTWVNDRIVALGTLRGGVVFVDLETSETVETANYYTGLPDNEVYALHIDHHQGVWIAHEYGFTRAAPFLPFRTYNHYPGLVGNLLCVQSFDEQVYVGTTLGLFRLTKEEIFEDEVYLITQATAIKALPVEEVKPDRKRKRGFLGLGKKKDSVEPQSIPGQKGIKQTAKKIQKVRHVLRGVEYVYKRVEGIGGKVDQLITVGDRLLCGGVGGVFEVNGLSAVLLTQAPVRTIFYSKNLKQLLVSTYHDEIKSFRYSGQHWQDADFPDSLSAYSDYLFEDNAQNLWICGRDKAIRIGIEEGEILDADAITLPHTSVDRTVGLAYGQEVYLTQNGEFFRYVSFKNAFVKYDSLPGPKKYFASAGYFWFYDGHRWRTVDRRLQGSIKTEWLALFPDLRFLAPAEQGKSLWVITASNELYKFSGDLGQAASEGNPLFLKEVRNQVATLSPRKLLVDERESALTFEFIQPEYVSLQAVEYHYWIKGLQPGWSKWSAYNYVINFPFLPPGKYNVMVESRDLFGKITKLDTIDVNVVPPYWKRPWFYALEFLFFGSLVVLSLRLNVANNRYRYLSRFLSALTVVLLIQFIQTIVYANITLTSSPVADFFLQVIIALLVLPVEDFLRKRMVNAAEKAKR